MTPLDLAKAFLAKGRADELLCERILNDKDINDALFGFHAQQAAEKYLKAVLAIDEERPEKTHDLGVLAAQCERAGHPMPEALREVFDLAPYAVDERYPFGTTPPLDRSASLDLVIGVRVWVEGLVDEGGVH